MQAGNCFLYVLKDSVKPMVKIGVANDVVARVRQIPQRIDFKNSFAAAGSREDCFRTERALHKILEKYRLDRIPGDGGTEWFSNECSEKIQQIFPFIREELGLGELERCDKVICNKSIGLVEKGRTSSKDEIISSALAPLMELDGSSMKVPFTPKDVSLGSKFDENGIWIVRRDNEDGMYFSIEFRWYMDGGGESIGACDFAQLLRYIKNQFKIEDENT